jgi:hypothetical protein
MGSRRPVFSNVVGAGISTDGEQAITAFPERRTSGNAHER